MKYDANHTYQRMQVGIVAEIHAILPVIEARSRTGLLDLLSPHSNKYSPQLLTTRICVIMPNSFYVWNT